MLGRCVPGESREINPFGCRGDIQALKATDSPERGNTRPTFDAQRVFYFPPVALAKIRGNINVFDIIMTYPGRHLHGCVCFCDATRFWDVQDGGVEERKRRAPDGFIRCSAPCSDWSIPAEESRLSSRAARWWGILESTRGLV